MIRPYLTAVALTLAALLVFLPSMARADDNEDASKKAAVEAMRPWLAEIDAGDYAKSWTDSAPYFQQAITSEKWGTALTNVRKPLGKLVSRKLETALLQNLPANGKMPAGTFVMAQFASSYENLKAARDTVTFQKDSDGSWRAVGYYIKPQ